jgi:hypothetical protein
VLSPGIVFAWYVAAASPDATFAREAAAVEEAASDQAGEAFADDRLTPEPAVDTSGERINFRGKVTQNIRAMAMAFLDLPLGAERVAWVDGKRYVFVLERHYHPPGYVGGPTGWHKGVTVYELLARREKDG